MKKLRKILLLLMLPAWMLGDAVLASKPFEIRDVAFIPAKVSLTEAERQQLSEAIDALVSGDHARAKVLLGPLAEAGVADAQLALAQVMRQSEKTADQQQGIKWLHLAAGNELVQAQLALAVAYEQGDQIAQDFLAARHWYRQAAQTGSEFDVLRNIVDLENRILAQVEELSAAKNYAQARSLLEPLSIDGHVQARYQLAKLLQHTASSDHQRQIARDWLSLAALQGNRKAQSELAIEVIQSYKNLPEENVRQAVRWLEAAAHPGSDASQYYLGSLYFKGDIVPKDNDKGLKWYGLAAEQGNVDAQYALGLKFALGEDVSKDNYEAHRWFRKAANMGMALAKHNLALTYLHGIGVSKNPAMAAKYFTEASEAGVQPAKQMLASIQKEQLPDKPVTPAKVKPIAGKFDNQIIGYEWLSGLPETGYTLQVMSVTQKHSIDNFLQKNNLGRGELLIYPHKIKQRKFDVLHLGYYKSHAEAAKAAKRISRKNAQVKPIVRSVRWTRDRVLQTAGDQ